jgi:hypothetical protein
MIILRFPAVSAGTSRPYQCDTWSMFAAAGRAGVVRELVEAWQGALSARRVGLVVVEGPSGSGKTAVMQVLYGQLALTLPRRMRSCWPTSCGCWVATTPTP